MKSAEHFLDSSELSCSCTGSDVDSRHLRVDVTSKQLITEGERNISSQELRLNVHQTACHVLSDSQKWMLAMIALCVCVMKWLRLIWHGFLCCSLDSSRGGGGGWGGIPGVAVEGSLWWAKGNPKAIMSFQHLKRVEKKGSRCVEDSSSGKRLVKVAVTSFYAGSRWRGVCFGRWVSCVNFTHEQWLFFF